MANRIESYISGSIDKKKIDKTKADWVREWFKSLFAFKNFAGLLFTLFYGVVVIDLIFIKIPVPEVVRIILTGFAFIGFPILFLILVIFLIRTVSVAHMFMYPEIKAIDFEVERDKITFIREDGKRDSHSFDNIRNITLIYNWRGIHVHAEKTIQYSLNLEPKDIEKMLNGQKYFLKQIFFLMSKEGYIRTVWYGNQKYGAENKSFTAGNKNLPQSLFSKEDLENNQKIIGK
jgi:hypothetical protein